MLLGLLMATVGTAPSGDIRLVIVPDLINGLPMVPTLVGLFTIPVLLEMVLHRRTRVATDIASLRREGFVPAAFVGLGGALVHHRQARQ